MIKTPGEIQHLREGGKRLAHVLSEVAQATTPGVSTATLNELAEKLIRAAGDTPSFLGYQPKGAKRPFPASICVSVNEEVVHGIPNQNPRTVKEGDIVGLDLGITHQGFITDHAVSVIAGVGDKAAEKLLSATQEALMRGINAARGGAHIGDIGAAVESVGLREGYGVVYELGGHGVGRKVHEEPYIPNVGKKGEGALLMPGMVIAIEPMFTEGAPKVRETLSSASRGRYERKRSLRSLLAKVKLMPDGYTFVTADGSRAAHFEHTILITEGEPEILTKL